MKVTGIHIAAGVMMGLLLTGAAGAADQPMTQTPYAHGHEDNLPNGMIGVSLQVGLSISAIRRCSMSVWCIRRDRLNKQGFDMEMKS